MPNPREQELELRVAELTARVRELEEQLARNETKNRHDALLRGLWQEVYRKSSSGIAILDSRGVIVDANPKMHEILRCDDGTIVSRSFLDFIPREEWDTRRARLHRLFEGMEMQGVEEQSFRRCTGERIILEVSDTVIGKSEGAPQLVSIFNDITAKNVAYDRMEETIRERTLLIQEIHHRVKNNLQVIASLARIAAGEDSRGGDFVKGILTRIEAMELIHSYLDEQELGVGLVPLREYLRELAGRVITNHAARDSRIQPDFEIPEELGISIGMATPLGILVSEILTHGVKQVPAGGDGTISLSAANRDGELTMLLASGNGSGISLIQGASGTVVKALLAQLQGKLRLGAEDGLEEGSIELSLPLHPTGDAPG